MVFYRVATIVLIFANALMAIFVYLRNRDNAVNYTFAALILSITSWIFANFMADNASGQAALIWTKLTFVTSALFAWLLLIFVLIFPEGKKKISLATDLLLFSPALIICLLTPSGLIVKGISVQPWGVDVIFGPWNLIFAVYFLSYIATATGLLIRSTQRARGTTRSQMIYVLLGLSLSIFLATMTNLIIPLAFNLFYPSKFGHLFTVLFVGFTTYAITRHHLLDIEIIIKKTVVYSFLTATLTGLFICLILLAQQFFSGILGLASFWVGLVAAFVIALVFQPLRDAIQRIVDRLFYKGKYDYRNTLKDLSHTSAAIIDLDRLISSTSANVSEALKPEKVAFYLWDKEQNCFRLKAS